MDLALAILGGIALLLFLLHLKTRTRNPNVPGPPPLPILGNLLEMLPFIKQKRPGLMFLNAINKYGPVTRVTLPGSDFIFVSDPAVVKQVMRGDGGKIIKDKSFEHIMVRAFDHLYLLPAAWLLTSANSGRHGTQRPFRAG
jgi:cytochrome P450